MKLILASTSPYRASLLKKSGVPFETFRPAVNEEELKTTLLKEGASPLALAQTLSEKKGESVWYQVAGPQTFVVSGDQIAECNGTLLGKPGTFESALKQLQHLRGSTHRLITAVTLLGQTGIESQVAVTELKMRNLSNSELERYLRLDAPYDCAGSYKIEENGIALFESIVSDDFTAIQGIPMIWLCNKLKEHHFEFFQP